MRESSRPECWRPSNGGSARASRRAGIESVGGGRTAGEPGAGPEDVDGVAGAKKGVAFAERGVEGREVGGEANGLSTLGVEAATVKAAAVAERVLSLRAGPVREGVLEPASGFGSGRNGGDGVLWPLPLASAALALFCDAK